MSFRTYRGRRASRNTDHLFERIVGNDEVVPLHQREASRVSYASRTATACAFIAHTDDRQEIHYGRKREKSALRALVTVRNERSARVGSRRLGSLFFLGRRQKSVRTFERFCRGFRARSPRFQHGL